MPPPHSPAHRRPPTRRPALTALALAIACTGAAAAAALVTQLTSADRRPVHKSSPPISTLSTVGPGPAVQAIALWLRTELPPGAQILADASTAALLRSAGSRFALGSPTTCRAGDFVVTATTPADAAALRCIHMSLPVAEDGAAQVRQVVVDVAAAGRERADALAEQRTGGIALAANRAIIMTAAVASAVRSGALDLRVEAVLAVLAQHGRYTLRALLPVAAETRAGLPTRSIELAFPGGTDVTAALAGVTGTYRPSSVTHPTPGATVLRWPFRTAPVPVLR
jgi:hypothetical protein